METCKYCGQQLEFVGEKEGELYFSCSFCDNMIFTLAETSSGRKRKMSVPKYINTVSMYASTPELLECNTITLYYTLKDIRAFWYHVKTLLEKAKVSIPTGQLPQANNEISDLNDVANELKKEYMIITKKKFVIENIILERTGFLPEKLTEDFLTEIYEQGKKESEKPMYVYIK
ncbi:MAG: hypothetical protein N2A99_06480 [Carnobacterium alterfunditum]